MKSKKKFLHNVLLPKKQNYFYPLSDDNLSKDDLNAGIKVCNMTIKTQIIPAIFKSFLIIAQ